jgi:hypothetical protein
MWCFRMKDGTESRPEEETIAPIRSGNSHYYPAKNVPKDTYELDEINQHSSDTERLLAQRHTLLWNEDKYLEIAPGQNNKPLSITYDDHSKCGGSLSWISACNQLKLHCAYQNFSNQRSIVDCVT